ncbi:probable 28S ribosomal protein S23, mitochondrial [Leguminivora glycinivorella]|uniref:probable 28S ribosomal protein S23, mitochondrial n=1 Tax=Leguminivora glycinivorella TaxID=1035111 RepID=UPI00200ED906|nr:probable 28S ribosomal protein S23, mitochondrial [Leguminivora glycinivorella]
MASSRLERIGTIFTRVEGLITRSAMKADDRPLWFDIYKRFPPLTEPKFAKPLPEVKPIRPILYEEDVVRAKFHSAGQGYGAINMLSPTGETPIKKLVKQYEKLKSEGVPETELVEKASAAVDTQYAQRQQEAAQQKTIVKNPDSVTAQVLAEADLKIFSMRNELVYCRK